MPCGNLTGSGGIIMMIFMMLFWLVFLAAIIVGIIFLVRYLGMSGTMPITRPKEEALEIAKTRYAKGEITKEEFEQMKKDLM